MHHLRLSRTDAPDAFQDYAGRVRRVGTELEGIQFPGVVNNDEIGESTARIDANPHGKPIMTLRPSFSSPMKLNSYTITQGRDRAPARAMYKAIGFSDADLRKPIIGIANTWTETMNCNYKLRDLAVYVKEGVRKAGGTPMEFNTVAISD